MTRKVDFFIPGKPESRSAGKITVVGGKPRTYHKKNSPEQKWFEQCQRIAKEHAPKRLLDGPLRATYAFYLERPKSAKKRRYPHAKPDLDNLEKLLNDALEGIVFVNDSRIVKKESNKYYPLPDQSLGVYVIIAELAEWDDDYSTEEDRE